MKILEYIYSPEFMAFLQGRLDIVQDAEDIRQEMAEIACTKPHYFEDTPNGEQRAFIVRCAINRMTDLFRYRKKRRFSADNFPKYQRPEVYGIMRLKDVREFLDRQKEGKLLMNQVAGYSTKEIVGGTKLRQGTATLYIHQTRKLLKSELI